MRGTDTRATAHTPSTTAPSAAGTPAAAADRHTPRRARWGTAAATALCLGLLAACGSGDGQGGGYVNDGAAGPEEGAHQGPQAPDRDVRLIPLKNEPPLTGPEDGTDGSGKRGGGSGGEDGESADGTDGESGSDGEAGGEDGDGDTGSPAPGESAGGAAKLSVGAHTRADGEQRWCERVTVPVHNSGGAAVTSGTITFTTKIVGLLGGDWGAVETRQSLDVPIEAGARAEQDYTVCVESWRVPVGMSIATEGVDVDWE